MELTGPLNQVKVIDFNCGIAGSFCTKLLAELGAQVIKIETTNQGNECRYLGPKIGSTIEETVSALHLYLNTNKKGLKINLETSDGLEILHSLIEWANILIDDHRPGYMSSLNLEYEKISKNNSGLIMTAITSFGQTGPYNKYETSELIDQALAGMLNNNGTEEREPLRFPRYQANFTAGANAAGVTLAALQHARITGKGQFIDVSIQESVVGFYYSNGSLYTYTGMKGPSRGEKEIYRTKDAGWAMPLKGRADWDKYALFFDAFELLEEKYLTPQGQQLHGQEIQDILTEKILEMNKHSLVEEGQKAGYPFGMVQTLEEVLNCPQVNYRNHFDQVEHAIGGLASYSTLPFKFSKSGQPLTVVAPKIGEHTDEILQKILSYGKDKITKLKEDRIV
jgi:crotonobetainyl-CoA:carnitine CoA-transferase CaiB-like acyl-CoA transferase